MFYVFGIIFVVGVVIAIVKAEPADDSPKKSWKPRKRLFSDAKMDYSKLRLK